MTKEYKIIGRGFNGWHAEYDQGSLSGVASAERIAKEAVDGALVYDASESDFNAFYELVMSGPMVDTRLADDEVDRFSKADRDTAAMMAPALGGEFQQLALLAQDEKYSGLDRVSVKIYEGLLRKVPGVKFGRVQDGKIIWE